VVFNWFYKRAVQVLMPHVENYVFDLFKDKGFQENLNNITDNIINRQLTRLQGTMGQQIQATGTQGLDQDLDLENMGKMVIGQFAKGILQSITKQGPNTGSEQQALSSNSTENRLMELRR